MTAYIIQFIEYEITLLASRADRKPFTGLLIPMNPPDEAISPTFKAPQMRTALAG